LGAELLPGIELEKVEDDGLVVNNVWVCVRVRVSISAYCLALGLVREGECNGCGSTGDCRLHGGQRHRAANTANEQTSFDVAHDAAADESLQILGLDDSAPPEDIDLLEDVQRALVSVDLGRCCSFTTGR
jgi:hypothetical protein